MITLFLTICCGILVGIFTGLLPALPVYIGPFILYYFHGSLSLEYLLVFWLVVVSGSQFFGSVATITTKIPGEESALVYLKDLDYLSLQDKKELLYQTAKGSLIAGIASTVFVYAALQVFNLNTVPFFSSLKFQIVLYSATLLSFVLINKNYVVTVLLMALGLLISPQNNYAIDPTWFDMKNVFQGFTFFMILLGVIIIPQLLESNAGVAKQEHSFDKIAPGQLSFLLTAKSTFIGMIAGLVPGPSATTAAIMAYKTTKQNLQQKIVAAETANNSSVITCALPLLAFSLPINQNTIIMSNLADLKSIFIPSAIFDTSFISAFTVLDVVTVSLIISLAIYYFLSTHLIDMYARLVMALNSKIRIIMILVIAAMIAIDVTTAETTLPNYLILLAFFTIIGFVLKIKQVSPLPLLFTIILGDKLIWLYLQTYKIYF